MALGVTIEAPPATPVVPLVVDDPLARLPVEAVLAATGWPRADAVCAWDFEFPPAPWPPVATATLDTWRIDFVPGRMLSSEVSPFVFT